MLIQTVVDEAFEGAKQYKSYCRAEGAEEYQSVELYLAEIEYDEPFVEALSRRIEGYTIHTVFTYDYESSSDAGDGRDDCYTEEADRPLTPNECIVKDGQFFGVLYECFDLQRFLPVESPETVVYHPGNYGGRNYHFYRSMQVKLVKQA